MWKKYPEKDKDAETSIKALVKAAGETDDKAAIKAADLAKAKMIAVQQLKAAKKDAKKAEGELVKLYNDAFTLVKEAAKAKAEKAKEESSEDTSDWKVVPNSQFKAELVKMQQNNKTDSEEKKLMAWMSKIKKLGPMKAADAAGIDCKPMSGKNEYHVYIGKSRRTYFTSDEKKRIVTLTGIDHQ